MSYVDRTRRVYYYERGGAVVPSLTSWTLKRNRGNCCADATAANIASVMDRLRSTFKRSRTPTGAEMKTQNSLEVPKQVRSVSFDEIKLGCAQRDEDTRKERSASTSGGHLDTGGGRSLLPSSLRVPAGGTGQRSRSFDSSSTASSSVSNTVASTGSGDRDDPGVFLEVPSSKHQLFHRRRSSGEKVPAAAACVHCAYLEELSKMNRSSSGDENQRYCEEPAFNRGFCFFFIPVSFSSSSILVILNLGSLHLWGSSIKFFEVTTT